MANELTQLALPTHNNMTIGEIDTAVNTLTTALVDAMKYNIQRFRPRNSSLVQFPSDILELIAKKKTKKAQT